MNTALMLPLLKNLHIYIYTVTFCKYLHVLHNNFTYFWLGKQEWFDRYIRIQSFQIMITKSAGYSYSGKNSTLKWTTVKAKISKSRPLQNVNYIHYEILFSNCLLGNITAKIQFRY
jgi:hypothetical protein